ncbi:nucleotidyltransferase [Thermoleophilia bacterium SCSIO 60948]|nr:nucleotidyltransferase [Thermoleophilia bacterium SCSIO 60948]
MDDANDTASEWGTGPSARIAEHGCILRTVVGSQVHGLVRAGTDDRDEMAITIEPPEAWIGLGQFEHHSHRTQPEGVPSGPGDLDLIVYSLRRYCRLALKGSPTVLLPLFAPPEHVLIETEAGRQLRAMADQLVIAGRVKESFLGYLQSQRKGLLEKGSGHGRPRERELSEEFGYDTKYAMHALRIGYQGIELLTDLKITLPVPEPQRSRLMDVRMGRVPPAEILEELDGLIAQLESAPVPHQSPPPQAVIEQWLVETYLDAWRDWEPVGLE